ncbi:hypothetical protein EUGRSUZ_I01679 [Eucalyptus grandis]|uniref:Uncharacterized protein n=2 Tax=Eucalyptus grandis TaxID=71139 RepID=A0ACC3JDP8_EUCGR|nr:hypothetical protein EUGRSUZ_I01679 [Eucalyptus grandis]
MQRAAQQQQQQMISQNSLGSLSFSSSMSLSREDEEMSRSALSTFRAEEEEIERKKMEEETKRLATIHEENGSEDDGGEDKTAEERETGGGKADEARHRVASSVWSGRHCSCPGTSRSSVTICFWLLHWQLVWLFVLDGIHVCVEGIGLEKKGYSQIFSGLCTSNL